MADFAHVTGLVLAAGAGRRAGGAKALRREADGTPWLQLAVAALTSGGCSDTLVVLGASATEARTLVPPGTQVLVADDWQRGLAASLRAGLAALGDQAADAALVTLVDLPALAAAAVARVLAASAATPAGSLARAVYAGRPGHPVLIGRDHWAALATELTGDRGAGPYLRARAAREIECGDLWPGGDDDGPIRPRAS